ncbi:helix-turn-helix transcriptional regulator [Sphingosinicella microcystinivorans]|uniref:LuxR family quorum-sensing system transcriptional regulator CciR n=1 Tax=Sphingosinicella microcystinivorans TaxID=335406 RepID=A0ABX9T492_SPHMI|nr:LuxR family transcriptional regulator [Sphingosinicella microcystinivorans]RKS92231.1 LuxR family quorum-sensing system transcriptional regulator CciR [Sphingosinicella microcystinivorans]
MDFRDVVSAVEDWATLWTTTEDAGRELGFELLAALHSRSLIRRSARYIRHDNYPMGWDRRLVARGQKIIDPILNLSRRHVSGFLWADALARARLTNVERIILDDGQRHGIRQGYTVPTNIPGEPEGSISFATRSTRRIGQERQFIADAIGRLAFDAARRLIGLTTLPDPVPHINDRERECIYWIAHGKDDRDIAVILGIGLETVRTNVKSAFRKLGVIKRGQLVYEAVRLGLIDEAPSIPPYG